MALGERYGMMTLQLRVNGLGRRQDYFGALGVSYAVAPRSLSVAPRGFGYTVAAGWLLPLSDGVGLRIEVDGTLIKDHLPFRLTAGI